MTFLSTLVQWKVLLLVRRTLVCEDVRLWVLYIIAVESQFDLCPLLAHRMSLSLVEETTVDDVESFKMMEGNDSDAQLDPVPTSGLEEPFEI